MSQVASKQTNNNPTGFGPKNCHNSFLGRPCLVAFHGAAASMYGFAIGWQAVSTKSAQLYQLTNPAIRVYGKWRFLTYQCLVIQFIAYSLTMATHFSPRFRRTRDFVFTTLAFPLGVVVVTTFWSVWFVAGREYIFPAALEEYYPAWLNHLTHSIILPVNLIQLAVEKHQYAGKSSYLTLCGHMVTYSSFIMLIRYQTGKHVYPILQKLDGLPAVAFMASCGIFALICLKAGKSLSNMLHKSGKCSIKGKDTQKSD